MRDGALVADPAARLPGRGAYTCSTPACMQRAGERGGFSRAFRQPVRIARPAAPANENVHWDQA